MNTDDFFEEHRGIMQTIEMNVVGYYRQHPNLVDHNVEKIYNGIQRTFEKEIQGKNPPRLRFSPLEQTLFDNIEHMCRIFVGEAELESLYDEDEELEALENGEDTDNKTELAVAENKEDAEAELDTEATLDTDDDANAELVVVENEDDIEDDIEDDDDGPLIDPVAKDAVVKSIKRLRGSIKTWTGNTYGKQGYLSYISQFM